MSKLAINGGPRAAEGAVFPAWPIIGADDRDFVLETFESGKWGRLEGTKVEEFERAYAAFQGAKHGIAATNGTAALELALLVAGVRPGDEVIVPAVTFIASASAVVRVGAVPVFADCDPDNAVISPASLEASITERTRACVLVHYGGYPCDFDAILPIARARGLAVIEDCAHAQGTEWRNKGVGSLGTIGAFSFQSSKSLTMGEGGIVVTDDDELAERARLFHNIGRIMGQLGYRHLLIGSNYRLSEMQAAVGLAQLPRLPEQISQRERAARFLAEELGRIGGLVPQRLDARITRRGFYFFVLRYNRDEFGGLPRDRFVEALRAEGVPCGIGYGTPLYRQPAFSQGSIDAMYAPGTRLPLYEEQYLPAVERFCAEEQVTIPHPVLLADRASLSLLVEAVAKIKANAREAGEGTSARA